MDRYGNGEEIALDKVLGSVRRIPSFLDFDKELFAGKNKNVKQILFFPSAETNDYREYVFV